MAIEAKNRGQFCKNLTRDYYRGRNFKNSVLIFAQFRTNQGFARKCAKISARENFYEQGTCYPDAPQRPVKEIYSLW